MVSGYLLRRLRSLAEAQADIERARAMTAKAIDANSREATRVEIAVARQGEIGAARADAEGD